MSSTKTRAPRTLLTLPSAWIIAIADSHLLASCQADGTARTDSRRLDSELAPDDRKPVVLDGDPEPDAQPELGRRRTRRIGPGPSLRVRLDGREAASGEVVADGLDKGLCMAPMAARRRRRD